MEKSVEHKPDDQKLRELGSFSREKSSGETFFISFYNCLKRGYNWVTLGLCSQVKSDRTRGSAQLLLGLLGLNIR